MNPTGIRTMERSDFEEVIRIYREGLTTVEATFETQVPTSENWDNAHLPFLRLSVETTFSKL